MRPHDRNVAASLYAQCFDAPWERAWTAAEFTRLLESPGCFGALLMTGDQPDGLALARVAADEAEVLTIGVVPTARRRGGATLLLSTLSRRCRRRGARHIFLEVAEDNLAARHLYEAHGFVIVGRRNNYFDRGPHGHVTALTMCRDFTAIDE